MAIWPTHKVRALKRRQHKAWLNSRAGKAWQLEEAERLRLKVSTRKRKGSK